MANTGDALAAGGIVNINTDLLKNFASQNLGGFLDAADTDPSLAAIHGFSTGTGGGNPSGDYNSLMPGNSSGSHAMPRVASLKTAFGTLASTLYKHVGGLQTKAEQFQLDLQMISQVITKAGDEAQLTASEMTADLYFPSDSSSSSSSSSSSGS